MQLKTSVETTLRITGSSDAQGKTLGEKSISDALGLASGTVSEKVGYPDANYKHRENIVENKATLIMADIYSRCHA